MKSLGEFLRSERKARGISLEQISADTRISMDMLLAIEDGNVELLPAPVLIKGFLKAYAKRIGIEPEGVIVKYQDLIEDIGVRREAIEKFHQKLHPKPARKRILVVFVPLALLAGLAFLLYTYISVRDKPVSSSSGKQIYTDREGRMVSRQDSHSRLNQKDTISNSQPTTGQTAEGPEPKRSSLKTLTPTIDSPGERVSRSGEDGLYLSNRSQQPVPPLSPSQAPYVLRAKAKETTWLRIIIDDSREREYLLKPGEQLTLLAKIGYKLHIGNAAGLHLYLNDKPLKPLGEKGKVVHLELPDPSLLSTSDLEQTEAVNRP